MSFSVPTFNLTCGIHTVTPPSNYDLRLQSACNLAMGKRTAWPFGGSAIDSANVGFTAQLLLPALTDVRDSSGGHVADVVEVPIGSGRFYQVQMVDDVGKGFPNEYRFATLAKIWAFGDWIPYNVPNWPIPIP